MEVGAEKWTLFCGCHKWMTPYCNSVYTFSGNVVNDNWRSDVFDNVLLDILATRSRHASVKAEEIRV